MKKIVFGVAVFGLLFVCSCGGSSASVTPTTTTTATTVATTTTETTKSNTPTPTPKPTNTPTPKETRRPTNTPTPTPRSYVNDSGYSGMCNTCHRKKATHGVFCDDCYYDEKQKLWNNGISDKELDMWANGYGWYDDDLYY